MRRYMTGAGAGGRGCQMIVWNDCTLYKTSGQIISPIVSWREIFVQENYIVSRDHALSVFPKPMACVVHLCLFPRWYRIPPSPYSTEPLIIQFVPTSHDCTRRRMQENGQRLLVSARGSSCNMRSLWSRSDRSNGRRLLCWQRKRDNVLITIHKTGSVNVRPASRLLLDIVTLSVRYLPFFFVIIIT